MSTYVHEPATDRPAVATRSRWALWGSAAGGFGILTNLVFVQQVEDLRSTGDAARIVDALDRTAYHLATVTGFAAVACLLVFAAGLARWASRQPEDSLALRAAPVALVASAGALIASYGVKGQLAIYLDGGFNAGAGTYPDESLYVYFLLDDLAGYVSWFGVTVALACLAWLSLRERLVTRWIGVVALVPVLAASAFLLVFGFPGFSGVIAPIALVPVGLGLARARS